MRIAIIGTGTIGVHSAHLLARRSHDVVAYEQFSIGHAFGSAGGDSRFFSRVELQDPRYSRVIARAEELWRGLNSETGAPLLDFTGGIMMGDPALDGMRRAIESCELTSHPRLLSAEEAEREFPGIRTNPGEVTLFDPNAGRIDPELSITLTARLAGAAGADIRERTKILAIDSRDAGGVRVQDDRGEEIFDRVIVTVGAWSRQLLGSRAPEVAIRRLTSAWFFPRSTPRFSSLVPFMRIEPDYVYGLPTPDGRAVKIGLGFEQHLEIGDPDTAERWLAPGEGLSTFRERLRYFPGIADDPFRIGTYFETYSPSRREYFHELPECSDILVLSGFSGHGFKVAPALGEAAADWATGASHRFPHDIFLA